MFVNIIRLQNFAWNVQALTEWIKAGSKILAFPVFLVQKTLSAYKYLPILS